MTYPCWGCTAANNVELFCCCRNCQWRRCFCCFCCRYFFCWVSAGKCVCCICQVRIVCWWTRCSVSPSVLYGLHFWAVNGIGFRISTIYNRTSSTVEDACYIGESAQRISSFRLVFLATRIADTAYIAYVQALLFKTGDRKTTHYTNAHILNGPTNRL